MAEEPLRAKQSGFAAGNCRRNGNSGRFAKTVIPGSLPIPASQASVTAVPPNRPDASRGATERPWASSV